MTSITVCVCVCVCVCVRVRVFWHSDFDMHIDAAAHAFTAVCFDVKQLIYFKILIPIVNLLGFFKHRYTLIEEHRNILRND